jgi:tRNA-dihydrouridine synthase B
MKIGSIDIPHPLFLAPMDEVTDRPFRLICKQLGADILISEFTSSEALIRQVPKAFDKITITPQEHPFGIQIFGYQTESMEKAVPIVEQFHPDFIDINCGCSVRKHVARGEGAGLLRDLGQLEKMVKTVVRAAHLPVTVKTRLGWSKEQIDILRIAKIVEQAGAQALCVHCRTRCQGYRGHADWTWLEKIKQSVQIPLIGNGDVTSPEEVKHLFDLGCDGVMIGRGAIANPWIFRQSKYYLEKKKFLKEPTLRARVNLCIKHLRSAIKFKGARAVYPFRKHYMGYLKGLPNVSKLRQDLMQLVDIDKIIQRLERYADKNSDKKI